MQRYLNQLLVDLESAIRHAPEATAYRFVSRFSDDEDDDFAPALHAKYVRLCDLFGISPDVFPPVERLTKAQVTSLLTTIENLWKAWHIAWDCPSRLTARRRYSVMVEKMTAESVRYSYDYGAEINFCDCRPEGKCPFGDKALCWCDEVEEAGKFAAEDYEALHRNDLDDPDDYREFKPSPVQQIQDWLYGTKYVDPWDIEEEEILWREFVQEEEVMSWLYFYQPQLEDEEPELSPEDFEDFEWGSPGYEDYDLPF